MRDFDREHHRRREVVSGTAGPSHGGLFRPDGHPVGGGLQGGTYSDPVDPSGGFAGATHAPGLVAPFIPRYTGVLGAVTKIEGFSHLGWGATGTVHYTDLDPSFKQSNYALLNAGLEYGGEHWKVTLFGNKLANRF